ncbi:MAG: type II toxin-antitoxin system RelE/ParE family toxin [Firmicutes bacterium]|nr:type II toxin-antitoxin system RelE/ParE family toxin [Bacillota bacterium]
MKSIVYSPEYREGILDLREYLIREFGENTAKKVIREITDKIHLLEKNENLGSSLKAVYGIETDYRYIFATHNYIFYRYDKQNIYIINLYNERVDFIRKLFKTDTLSESSLLDTY